MLGKTFTFKHTLCIFRLYDLLTYNRKGYKKRLCVTILRSSTTKIWVRLVHEQNIQITQDKCWPDKETIFFFSIKKTQKTDNFVTHFRSQNKKKINKKYFHSHCMGKDWMSISMLVFKYGKLWINMNETQQMEYTNTRTAYHTFSVTHSKALFTFFPGRKVFILQLIKFSTFHFCLLWGTRALLTFHRIGLGHCLLLLGQLSVLSTYPPTYWNLPTY